MSYPPLIYVVDDDQSFRTALTRLLHAAGYAVETFSSAAEFLNRPAREGPACAILDLRLPGPDGMELHGALSRADDQLPVIFLTGHGDIPTSVRAMRQGAIDFLTKPVKKEALLDAVRRALEVDATRREQRARMRSLREIYERLTTREREVLEHVLRGRMNKQIASELGTCERTIKAHRAAIVSKLGVGSVAEMVRFAQELQILPVTATAPGEPLETRIQEPR